MVVTKSRFISQKQRTEDLNNLRIESKIDELRLLYRKKYIDSLLPKVIMLI